MQLSERPRNLDARGRPEGRLAWLEETSTRSELAGRLAGRLERTSTRSEPAGRRPGLRLRPRPAEISAEAEAEAGADAEAEAEAAAKADVTKPLPGVSQGGGSLTNHLAGRMAEFDPRKSIPFP